MCGESELVKLNEYLSKGIHDVEGWCLPQLWYALWPLAQIIGPGPIAEIGVYKGKFFTGLCKTFATGPDNMATAIDVFDMQEFNLDGAGEGNLDAFRANLDAQGVGAGNVHYVIADSLSLRDADREAFLERTGACAFFSVDGCHEVVHTINDIEFALSVTRPDGIVAVDDYLNPNWPGVQEAVARMYLMGNYSFVPLVVTCNKLLLCSLSYHGKYLRAVHDYIRDNHEGVRMKKVKRFGFETLTVQPNFQEWQDLS